MNYYFSPHEMINENFIRKHTDLDLLFLIKILLNKYFCFKSIFFLKVYMKFLIRDYFIPNNIFIEDTSVQILFKKEKKKITRIFGKKITKYVDHFRKL